MTVPGLDAALACMRISSCAPGLYLMPLTSCLQGTLLGLSTLNCKVASPVSPGGPLCSQRGSNQLGIAEYIQGLVRSHLLLVGGRCEKPNNATLKVFSFSEHPDPQPQQNDAGNTRPME